MKKLICILLLFLLPLCAYSESTLTVTAEAVGSQYTVEGYPQTLYRLTVANASGKTVQALYAFAEIDREDLLVQEMADVNFDGHDDLVLMTRLGASNACYVFFLWDEARGQFSTAGTPAVWNYTLYPEKALLLSHANNGFAGILHESTVYGWENGTLKPLRSVAWETYLESRYDFGDGSYTYTEYSDDSRIVETYTVYGDGGDNAQQTFVFPTESYRDMSFYSAREAAENEFLGLN